MTSLFAESHNMFWNTAVVKHSGDVTRLQALVDKKRIVISKEVVREILQLNDAEGVVCLPNKEIFVGLARMGYEKPSTKLTFYKAFFSTQWKFFIHTILHSLSAKRTSWNEFSSAMASALICLSSGQRFNFSKYIFESLVRNVDSSSKLYMYPRFIQLIIQSNIADLSKHTNRYIFSVLTQKVFANMRRVGKGFSEVETPLFETMLAVRDIAEEAEAQIPAQDDDVQEHAEEKVATDVVPPTPTSPSPSSPIVKLKARVKKLEKLNKVKSSKLRRLRKVGTSQRVESSDDAENVFNHGRISVDMDQDEGIVLVVDQEKNAEIEGRQADKQAEIYNIDLDHSSKVLSCCCYTPISTAKPKVLKIAAAPAVLTRRRKGVVIRDPEEELHTDTPAETPTVKDKGKGILIEDPKPMKKKDQVEMDAEYAKKLKEELNKEHEEAYKQIDWNASFDHTREEMEKEDEKIIKSINETPTQKVAKRRKRSEEAQKADDLKKRLEIVQDEDDDVFVEATLLAQKVPVMDYQVVVIDNKPRYKIIRADDTHQFYISFTTLLKNFDKEDLETLWRIVKDIFSTKKPTNFSYEYLLLTLKTMFGELDEQDAIWRNQKSLFLLVERRYPLSRFTLEQLVNVARLHIEEEISTFLLQNHFFKGSIDPTLFTRRFHNDILVSKYVLEILKKYGMESFDPVGTPMEIKDKINLDQNGTPVDATKYRSMIGALMYLTSSRPDIVHATCLCARYQAKPTEKHLKEVKRIFRYLQGIVNTGLWYSKDSGFELTGFSDAYYAGCKDTFKSTSGGA
nr:uncharacterized mitochondrial protein AtMg00810-like [Tanacetum cinerariifolium]